MSVLGVDFGTSNSAAGVAPAGVPQLIALEPGQQTLPTAVFFDFEDRKMLVGQRANDALLGGDEGLYMRALKSLLGTSLMRETRSLLGERIDFIEITSRFLRQIKTQAEAATGDTYDRVLSGRPVMFHSSDPARNAQAEVDLRDAYLRAGFAEVRFMNEPEAAALANRDVLNEGDLGLILDIGGGTSDFTLFRHEGDGINILGSHGVRVGGTDFDRALSIAHVMPLLGKGSPIRHAFGPDTHPAPHKIFNDLATWQKIPFLYAQDTRRAARELEKYAVEKPLFGRLCSVLEDELGHDLAFAVEAGKIAANGGGGEAAIALNVLERGLSVPLPTPMMADTLSTLATEIGDAADTTLQLAGVKADAVTHLIFVGGSSLMGVIEDALSARVPAAKVQRGAALTAIVDGLAIGAEAAFND
ncbi:Hsp70 family protein [Sulfitobacter sp. SK012]|uniref:Hsp70 family protein n=1 Tax=Sulfitobacter sp. SK012 TaxID=1389005 RepID=UPI0015777BCA|nr:Hsp70 family protein [Sulfitobacter sp. SK012]